MMTPHTSPLREKYGKNLNDNNKTILNKEEAKESLNRMKNFYNAL